MEEGRVPRLKEGDRAADAPGSEREGDLGPAGRKARLWEQRIISGTNRSTNVGGSAKGLTWGGACWGESKGDRGPVRRGPGRNEGAGPEDPQSRGRQAG